MPYTPADGTLVYDRKRGEKDEMGRTNIEIDDDLVDKAMRLTGATTKREVVDIALRRLIEKGSLYRSVRRLRGQLEWEGDVSAWRSARARK